MATSKHCDLCGTVITHTYWLYLGTQCYTGMARQVFNVQDLVELVKESQTGQCDDWEVCEECKELIKRIFTYKKEKIGTIIDELDRIYKIKTEGI